MSNIILNADISENSSFASNLTRLSPLPKNKIVIPSKINEPDNNTHQHDKSSFVSKLTRLSKNEIVIPSKISEPDNNTQQHDKSSFVSKLTRLSKNEIVIPSKISEPDNNTQQQHDKSSFVSKLTRFPPKQTVLNPDMSENHSLASNFTRLSHLSTNTPTVQSDASKLSYQRSVTSSVSDTKSSVQQIPISSKSTASNTNYDAEIASNTHSENSTHISVCSSENSGKPLIPKPSVITNSNNSIHKTQPNIANRVVIDVAVLCQEYTTIETMCHDNIINLDEILITKEVFQSIFYPYHDNFGLNKDFVCNNKDISTYISFIPEFRSVNSKKFYLLEEIIANIERDLNISRNCFTKESLVELTNEIISIKSLCDINCCSVLASLSWQNILEIIKNYQLINYCQCEKGPESDENYCKICKNSKSEIIPICVVNIIFKTPTPGVKNTIIRFNYRITNL
jgi:hypothetical protein